MKRIIQNKITDNSEIRNKEATNDRQKAMDTIKTTAENTPPFIYETPS